MIILLIIGLTILALAIAAATGAFSPNEGTRSGAIRKRIGRYSFARTATDEESDSTDLKKKADDVATKIGTAVAGRSKHATVERVRTLLVEAGMYNTTPGTFMGYRVLVTRALPLLWIWLAMPAALRT